MQQQQLASIIEYSNAIHVQPPTKTICVGTYRSFYHYKFQPISEKRYKNQLFKSKYPTLFSWSKKLIRIDRISTILIN